MQHSSIVLFEQCVFVWLWVIWGFSVGFETDSSVCVNDYHQKKKSRNN